MLSHMEKVVCLVVLSSFVVVDAMVPSQFGSDVSSLYGAPPVAAKPFAPAPKEAAFVHNGFEAPKESSMNQQIQHQSEIVELKDKLRRKESHFNVQVNALRDELNNVKLDADRNTRNLQAVGMARQAQLRNEMEATVAEKEKRASQATNEISSLLEKYQNLKESSMNTQIQYQSEVVELKDQLRRKESHFSVQLGELKDELKSTQQEADRKARDLEAVGAARQARLRKEMETTMAEKSERADHEVKEAKNEVSSLLKKYQDLQETSQKQQIQHQSEVVELKDELRKKESFFTVHVNGLKEELRNAETEADRKARDLRAVGAAREAKIRQELEVVVAENKKQSKYAGMAKKEISSLLENYQSLQASSQNREIQLQFEVVGLKNELMKKESEFDSQMGELQDELRNAKLMAHRQAQDLQASGGTEREAKLRQELNAVVTVNKEIQLQLDDLKRRYKEEIMDWEDLLEGEQDIRMRQQREAEIELHRVKEEARKAKSRATVQLANKEYILKAQDYSMMKTKWDLSKREMELETLKGEMAHGSLSP